MNYYERQLAKLEIEHDYDLMIKVLDNRGNFTYCMNLNDESIPVLIGYLLMYRLNKKRAYLKHVIDGKPADEKLLRKEYKELTGKNYRRV